jgi:hypothetical protein
MAEIVDTIAHILAFVGVPFALIWLIVMLITRDL